MPSDKQPLSPAPRASVAEESKGMGRPSRNRNIVVAVDDDRLSWQAVRFAVQELYREGDVLHLLHVIPKDSVTVPVAHPAFGSHSFLSDSMGSIDFETYLWEHATHFIKSTMVGLAAERQAACEVDIVTGECRQSIGHKICEMADKLEASFIVIPGRHNPGFFESVFAGDSAGFGSYVAQWARQPTVIYQPRAEPEQSAEGEQSVELEQLEHGKVPVPASRPAVAP